MKARSVPDCAAENIAARYCSLLVCVLSLLAVADQLDQSKIGSPPMSVCCAWCMEACERAVTPHALPDPSIDWTVIGLVMLWSIVW